MENKSDQLSSLYYKQFTDGCDKITCKNTSCKHCKDFKLSSKNSLNENLHQIADQYAQNHQKSPKLCESMCYMHFDESNKEVLNEISSFAKSDINDLSYGTQQINLMFSDKQIFSRILNSNDLPLTISNSRIDDSFFFEFSEKISKNADIDNVLLACLTAASQWILGTKKFFNSYLNMRIFIILFYFPGIISPAISPPVFIPLIKLLAAIEPEEKKVFCSWMSQLHLLRKQMVGFLHTAISTYYADHPNTTPHSDTIHSILKAMSFLHTANADSSQPISVSCFYDEIVNQLFNIEEEMDLFIRKNIHGRRASLLKKYPFVLSLETKENVTKAETKQQMKLMAQHAMMLSNQSNYKGESYMILRIRRKRLLKDAIDQLSKQDQASFLKKLKVIFENEEAVDVGGPSREFLYSITEQLFAPDYNMFEIKNERYMWFSPCTFETERSFFLTGCIVGLAIHNSVLLPIRFPLIVYKRLLHPDKAPNINDLFEIEPDVAKSLISLLEIKENGGDVSDAMLTFSTTVSVFDDVKEVQISDNIPIDTPVTNENLNRYIKSYINFKLVKQIEVPFESFQKGFYMTCNCPTYKLLEPEEMDILVSGVELYDWEALKSNTTYSDGYTDQSKQIKWFWEFFKSLTKENKLKLLKFATGTDRAPIGGLGQINLKIKPNKNTRILPTARTCFNTLIIPKYKTKEELMNKVGLSMQHTEGFGLK